MKFLLSILLTIFLNSNLSAQFIFSGTIKNSLNNPLANTSVVLSNHSNNQKRISQTDSTGFFSFKNLPAGIYFLKISLAEYEKYEKSFLLAKDSIVNIFLVQSNVRLNEVTVTANKQTIKNNIDEVVYNVSNSITAKGGDALTALTKIPGIKVDNNGVSIAGKGEAKVMVNNQLVQLSGTDLIRYLKSISSNQVSKIELIKNPSSAYDAEGNAGLINITTKQSKKQGYSGNIQVSDLHWFHHPAIVYGTSNYWLANGSANISYNSKKWSVYGSLNVAQDHELEGFETDVFYPKQSWLQTDTGDYTYQNINVVAGVEYKLSKKATFGMSYLGGKNIYVGSDNVNNPIYNNAGTLDSTLHTYATYHPVAFSNSINLHTVVLFDTSGKKTGAECRLFQLLPYRSF